MPMRGIVLLTLCLWTGWQEMRGQLEFTTTSATLGIPYTWFWGPLLLGLALGVLGCLISLWAAFRNSEDDNASVNDV